MGACPGPTINAFSRTGGTETGREVVGTNVGLVGTANEDETGPKSAKVLARRIENILPKLVDSDQTGFVNGKCIGQNIRLLNDIMEYTDIKNCQIFFVLLTSKRRSTQ